MASSAYYYGSVEETAKRVDKQLQKSGGKAIDFASWMKMGLDKGTTLAELPSIDAIIAADREPETATLRP